MSVAETKEQLTAAAYKGGEAAASLATAMQTVAEAMAAVQDAKGVAAMAFEGSGHKYAEVALGAFSRCEKDLEPLHQELEDAQSHALMGVEQAQAYVGWA